MPTAQHKKNTFKGYHSASRLPEEMELTQVGRGTDAGEYLRRFWHPIALTEELQDLAVPISVLGEDLVLFRDGRGEIGLLHRHCSHRGTSLEFGIVGDRGIRCCYHGWLYDTDGTLLETPSDPDSTASATICHGAYPTVEHAGLVFAYLGPPEQMPEFPLYDSWKHPSNNELIPFKLTYPCNWLQVHENTADPIHIPFLHGRVSGTQFSPGFSDLPTLSFRTTPIGMAIASTRYTDGRLWFRSADAMLPNVAQYPPAYETDEAERLLLGAWVTRWVVPSDDKHCCIIGFRHFNDKLDPENIGDKASIGVEQVDFAGQTAAPPHLRQRTPGDYEAIVSQGPIAVHAQENLVRSDRGVARLRKQLRNEIHRLRDGTPPSAFESQGEVATYTYEAVIPWPSAPTMKTLSEIGERLLDIVIETGSEPFDVREAHIATELRKIKCR